MSSREFAAADVPVGSVLLCPPQARPLALAPTISVESASLSGRRNRAKRKRNFPHPPWVAAELPSPPLGAGRGPRVEEEISSGFSFFLGSISEKN